MSATQIWSSVVGMQWCTRLGQTRFVMPTVGRAGTKGACLWHSRVVFAHQSQNPLVVDGCAFPPQQRADTPVAIASVAQGRRLDRLAQVGVGARRRALRQMAVVTGPRDLAQAA